MPHHRRNKPYCLTYGDAFILAVAFRLLHPEWKRVPLALLVDAIQRVQLR